MYGPHLMLSHAAPRVLLADAQAHSLEGDVSAARAPLSAQLGGLLCLAGVLLVTALAATSRAPLVYDEVPYLKPVALVHRYGLSLRLLSEYPEPAGLLHNVLHRALEPWTGLAPPRVRLVNPALLGLTLMATWLTLRLLGAKRPAGTSVTLIAIPSIWVMTGMVLTELPSIFLTSSSVYLLVLAQRIAPERRGSSLALALGGGALLGLAFLSRASVLVVLGALPCLVRLDWKWPAAYALGALLVAGPIIGYWGGLVPPQSVVAVGASSVSAYNLLLSFCYGAVMMLILAPRWFDLPARAMLPIAGVIVLANAFTGALEINVARSVVARLPGVVATLVPRLAGGAMLALAALFLVSSLKHLYVRRHDPVWLFLCVATLLLVASPGKITHQFSSRYTGMASGMMVMASEPFAPPSAWSVIGPAIGMMIGLASLLSYYAIGTP
jgi:hypothetical protein